MPGVSLNITLPVVGTDTWPEWAESINDALETIIADIEPLVTSSEISVTSHLDLNGFICDDAKYFRCRAGNEATIGANAIGVKDGEWYVGDGAGRSIQVTSNGALNIAAAAGFTGDYTSAGAQAEYTDATTLYEFLDGAGNYADIRADDVIVSNGANAVTITYGTAANYTLTLPAVPAAVALLTMDNVGTLSTSATIATAITTTANITLSGAADIKHPDRTYTLLAAPHNFNNVTAAPTETSSGRLSATGAWTAYFSVPCLKAGDRFKSVVVSLDKGDANITTVGVHKVLTSSAAAPAAAASNTNVTSGITTCTVTSTQTIAAGESIVISVAFGAAAVNNRVHNLQIALDRT